MGTGTLAKAGHHVEIREIDPHGGPGRKIEDRSLSECRRAQTGSAR